jgi:choice-of-anchor B domain-containing protein
MNISRTFRFLPLLLIPSVLLASGISVRPFHEEPLGDIIQDPHAQNALAAMAAPATCQDGLALATFPCRGIDLESYVSLNAMLADTVPPGMAPDPAGSALWGFQSKNDGREYAVFGTTKGAAFVDVTDPSRPVAVGSVPGLLSPWRELKVYQFFNSKKGRYDAYAYVVSEAPGSGLQIIDLSDLPASVRMLGNPKPFERAHTVYLANVDYATGASNVSGARPVLYVEGSNVAGLLAFDLSDPAAPELIGSFFNSYSHDIWAGVLRGSRASACPSGADPCEIVVNWAGDAIRIIDFTSSAWTRPTSATPAPTRR